MANLLFRVDSIIPDVTQYKKYGMRLFPDDLYLEIEVNDKEVMQDGQDTIITEQGMADVLTKLGAISSKAERQYALTINER